MKLLMPCDGAMSKMGVPAKIYHDMNTADYRKKVTKYQWQCQQCGHVYNISSVQHKRIQAGRSGARCSFCGGLELIYLGSKKNLK